LPTIRHRCNVEVWALAQSWAPLTRDTRKVLSAYNVDSIFVDLMLALMLMTINRGKKFLL